MKQQRKYKRIHYNQRKPMKFIVEQGLRLSREKCCDVKTDNINLLTDCFQTKISHESNSEITVRNKAFLEIPK